MVCLMCGEEKLTTVIDFGIVKIALCNECMGKSTYRIIEICPYCGRIVWLYTDIYYKEPHIIPIPCPKCDRIERTPNGG